MPERRRAAPPLPDRIIGRYMNRLLAVAAHDDEVARTFVEVMGMLAPPPSILRPAIVTASCAAARRAPGRGRDRARAAHRRGAPRRSRVALAAAEPLAEAA